MGKIRFDRRNYRRHTDKNKAIIKKSLSELGAGRSVLLDNADSLIAGNGVYEQAQALGIPVRVVETDGSELIAVKRTDVGEYDEKRRRLALADNAASDTSEWDLQALGELPSIDLQDWGIEMPDPSGLQLKTPEEEAAEIERKEAEFRERIARGEISEEDADYQEFVEKFKLKKTTDDCYTPELIYDAVADWVANEYHLSRANFVRPFYPGGDYQKEKYAADAVVVDNPPFSIMAEILRWYDAHGIRFFLFGPHFTIFSCSSRTCTALPVCADITYANGANVKTSFLTNLEPRNVRVRSCPSLYRAVQDADDKNRGLTRKHLPKYEYDKHVVIAPFFGMLSRLGIDFVVPVEESASVAWLESQKAAGKQIFGKGYLISDRLAEERVGLEALKKEREKEERNRQEQERKKNEEAVIPDVWTLSEKELAIVRTLNEKRGTF